VKKKPEVVARRMAQIGKILLVEIPQGEKVFDLYSGELLGVVEDRKPVVNGDTCFISPNDYEAAKQALPAAPKPLLPGLPGGASVH